MKEIIKNTRVTFEEVNHWRKQGTDDEVPLMIAKRNAQVCKVMNELSHIRLVMVNPDEKIDLLIEILMRGINFEYEGNY